MNFIPNESDEVRALSNAEKAGMTNIQDMGLGLIRAIEANVPASREVAIAIEHVETAVMWAMKGLQG